MKRAYAAVLGTAGLFLLVQLGALALVEPFMAAGYQPVEDPSDPVNVLVYVGAILAMTLVLLVAIRFDVTRVIQGLIIFASVFISFYVFSVLLPAVVVIGGVDVLAVVVALGLGIALLAYPEWYVIDSVGVVMGAGASALFGISFGLLPAIAFLIVLAVYDAISVYGTEHMLALASGVMELRLPIVLVVPMRLSYSFLEEGGPDSFERNASADESSEGDARPTPDDETAAVEGEEGADEGTPDDERSALFIGLGDTIIPTILVVSAAFFRPGDAAILDVPGIALTVPAAGAIVGTVAGLLVLEGLVLKGRPHAGLPLLNGGAIAGYLVATLAVGIDLVEALGVGPYL